MRPDNVPEHYMEGWKAVRPDLTTNHGFRWWPGTVVESVDNIDPGNTGVCPAREGDGLCVAKTWKGAGSAGFPTSTCVVVYFDPADVAAEDDDKLRVVGPVHVGAPFDAQAILRAGFGEAAVLSYAVLRGADLRYADLSGADLRYADLSYANLSGADLRYAVLSGADLRYAVLSGAVLRYAVLSGAVLRGAVLRYAVLSDADLSDAVLRYADLSGGDLRSADLRGARWDKYTKWPEGFDFEAATKPTGHNASCADMTKGADNGHND